MSIVFLFAISCTIPTQDSIHHMYLKGGDNVLKSLNDHAYYGSAYNSKLPFVKEDIDDCGIRSTLISTLPYGSEELMDMTALEAFGAGHRVACIEVFKEPDQMELDEYFDSQTDVSAISDWASYWSLFCDYWASQAELGCSVDLHDITEQPASTMDNCSRSVDVSYSAQFWAFDSCG